MGAAQSSNVAKAVTNVSNFVSNSTSANSTSAQNLIQSTNLKGCTIKLSGDFNVRSNAKLMQTNNQILSAKQDINLSNNIQQQALQEATSTVGFAGVGYASASNATNTLVNSTTEIINDINASANQYSSIDQSFNCNRSTIIAENLNIGFNSESDFLSSQTLKNNQTATVVNKVSQIIDQKATATVEGIGLFLIILLLMIALVIYGVTAPLSSGAMKTAFTILIIVSIVGIITYMFINSRPPFFAEPDACIHHSAIGMGNSGRVPECKEVAIRKLNLITSPTKYIYSLTKSSPSVSGGNLMQMAISKASGQNKSDSGPNGGYRVDTYENLKALIKEYDKYADILKIPNIPNPLVVPTTGESSNPYYAIPIEYIPNSGDSQNGSVCTPGIVRVGLGGNDSDASSEPFRDCVKSTNNSYFGRAYRPSNFSKTSNPSLAVANINNTDWDQYLQPPQSNSNSIYRRGVKGFSITQDDEANVRALFARFVLCDIIGNMELHHYVSLNEFVKFINSETNEIVIGLAGENGIPKYPNDTYFFKPSNFITDWKAGTVGGGTLEGYIGYRNTNQYKFNKFMANIGLWIIAFAIAIICMFIKSIGKKNEKTPVSIVNKKI